MDTRAIATIVIKVAGLVMIVVSVVNLPAYFPLTHSGYNFSIGETLGTAALALGPLALIGLLLWFFPGTITNRIVSGASPTASVADFRPLELVAFTVLGIYLVAGGIIGLVRDVVVVIVVHRENADSSLIPSSIVAHTAATVAQLVIGAGLSLGANGVSKIVERLRG